MYSKVADAVIALQSVSTLNFVISSLTTTTIDSTHILFKAENIYNSFLKLRALKLEKEEFIRHYSSTC